MCVGGGRADVGKYLRVCQSDLHVGCVCPQSSNMASVVA